MAVYDLTSAEFISQKHLATHTKLIMLQTRTSWMDTVMEVLGCFQERGADEEVMAPSTAQTQLLQGRYPFGHV